jgi:hypothetical protein
MAKGMLEAEHFKCSKAVVRLGELKPATRNGTNTKTLCYFDFPGSSLRLSMPASSTFSQEFLQPDAKFVARIRNTLILGLVYCLLNHFRKGQGSWLLPMLGVFC